MIGLTDCNYSGTGHKTFILAIFANHLPKKGKNVEKHFIFLNSEANLNYYAYNKKKNMDKIKGIDKEMEKWGTETAEGSKIWGSSVIYCLFLLKFYFLFRQNLGGGHDPGPPASGAPGKREQEIQ